MRTRIIHGDSHTQQDIDDIIELLSSQESGENYSVNNWWKKPHTLLYVLLKSNRFNLVNGGLVLIYDNDLLCAVSGYNRSDFNPEVYILGSRTIIKKNYQHQLIMSSLMIPAQLEQVKSVAKMVMFLFDVKNEFNLYTIFVSGKLNQFLKNKLNTFDSLWNNLKACEYPVSIFSSTVQNALYIKLDEEFIFDWDQIKYRGN